jgi:hypothetical protein
MSTQRLCENYNKVLEHFDFGRVKKHMEATKWEWLDKGVPDIHEMRSVCDNLFITLLTEKVRYCATGGFWVMRTKDDDIRIAFVVAERSSTSISE